MRTRLCSKCGPPARTQTVVFAHRCSKRSRLASRELHEGDLPILHSRHAAHGGVIVKKAIGASCSARHWAFVVLVLGSNAARAQEHRTKPMVGAPRLGSYFRNNSESSDHSQQAK